MKILREIVVPGFNRDEFQVNQVLVSSRDGTKVPMVIVSKQNIPLDGSHPIMLYAYGGFNISITPSFSVSRIVLTRHLGAVFCFANIRGGGEYGEEWHKSGSLSKKQNCFDDFISAAEYLVSYGYTQPKKLCEGGSNGGLLIAACINQDSVTAQQLGSGLKGLGLGSIAFDWNMTLWGMDPLVMPMYTIINSMVGFTLFIYIITPFVYWRNLYNAKRFLILSTALFDNNGGIYNISRVIDTKTFTFDKHEFNNYSKIHLSATRAISYGFSFASEVAAITHVALFYGRTIWRQFKDSHLGSNGDAHTRLMKKYEAIPQSWFFMILVLNVPLAFVACLMNRKELQIPIWGLMLALSFGFILVLPVSVIRATTDQFIPTNIMHKLIIGYLFPGKPLAT